MRESDAKVQFASSESRWSVASGSRHSKSARQPYAAATHVDWQQSPPSQAQSAVLYRPFSQ